MFESRDEREVEDGDCRGLSTGEAETEFDEEYDVLLCSDSCCTAFLRGKLIVAISCPFLWRWVRNWAFNLGGKISIDWAINKDYQGGQQLNE